jgi:hypothetical protein
VTVFIEYSRSALKVISTGAESHFREKSGAESHFDLKRKLKEKFSCEEATSDLQGLYIIKDFALSDENIYESL